MTLSLTLIVAPHWVEIAEFGKKKLELLRRFRSFNNGTPSHDQLGDLFAALDAEQFQRCFIAWVGSPGLRSGVGPDIVAIDGKTLRRSYQEGGAKAPIHMISAWSSRQRLVLGQAKVAEKSNEITAIPELLKLLTLKGAIVTIDAMGWRGLLDDLTRRGLKNSRARHCRRRARPGEGARLAVARSAHAALHGAQAQEPDRARAETAR